MGLGDHVGSSGVVTNQALIATLQEEIVAYRRELKLGRLPRRQMEDLQQAIDENLDRIAKLKRRI
ncbi:hypothetical protein [Streptomyces sp. S186]|uniref:hypothetical protein n=1 Tax=Streptomyces sp. S186 TaxID=3434395 RepID=UPI003F66A6C1